MRVQHLFRQLLIWSTFLFPLVCGGTLFAETEDELNVDFIKAAFSGNLPEVERLLAKGANINAKRENGTTALIGASIEGQQEVVEFLLNKGADVDAKVYFFGRSGGATACDLADQKGHKEVVKLLVRAGAFHEERVEAPREVKAAPKMTGQQSRRND